MKKVFLFILATLIVLLIFGAFIATDALLVWGLGNLIIYLFGIDFTWTYLYSLGASILLMAIGSYFRSTNK